MDQSVFDKYELVCGLEVHAQLLTESKAFATDSTEYGQMPNTNISVITLGHPGVLPRFNQKAAEFAIKMGLACHSEISRYNIFDRKNYFYPDLPKGYQITQDKTPICRGGYVEIKTKDGNEYQIALTRIHCEEDAGKSLHLDGEEDTLVDLNRAGVPLIEIVSEPDMRTSDQAYAYLTEIRKMVRYLEICDGNMEEGSMRCDANVSVRLKGSKEFGKKVEVKNMNSITNVKRAIDHEFERQVIMMEKGEPIPSETRLFNAQTGLTASMRSKEDLNDYRYFPEPDLPPFIVTDEMLQEIKEAMPPLPQELYRKFLGQYGLSEYDARVLTDTKEIALFFESVCTHTTNYKAASNWVMGSVKSYLNELTLHIDEFPLSAAQIAQIIALIDEGKISTSAASQRLFPKMTEQPGKTALEVAQAENLIQESGDDFILPLIEQAIAKFPDKVKDYQGGKKNLLGLFMGEVMKMGKGKVDPQKANTLIQEALDKAQV